MKALLALILFTTSALAQPRPTAMQIMQSTVGACVGQNAELAVRIDGLMAEVADLKAALEKAKPQDAPREAK